MVIDASRIFGCAHTFVAVQEGRVLLFVCDACGHRTELLSLRPPARTIADRARGELVESFTARRSARG
jgi:hypothetical protein